MADEIRKLAEESSVFALGDRRCYKRSLLLGSEKAVDLMNGVREEAEYQTNSVERTGEKLHGIREK